MEVRSLCFLLITTLLLIRSGSQLLGAHAEGQIHRLLLSGVVDHLSRKLIPASSSSYGHIHRLLLSGGLLSGVDCSRSFELQHDYFSLAMYVHWCIGARPGAIPAKGNVGKTPTGSAADLIHKKPAGGHHHSSMCRLSEFLNQMENLFLANIGAISSRWFPFVFPPVTFKDSMSM